MDSQILHRLSELERRDTSLTNGLRTAYSLLNKDPQLSLAKARIILERVCRSIYTKESKQSGQNMDIGALLNNDAVTKIIPPRILSRMHTIRSLGNLAIHDQKIIRQDVTTGLDSLLHVLEWYDRHYNKRPQQKPSSRRFSALPIFSVLGVISIGLAIYFLYPKFKDSQNDVGLNGNWKMILVTEKTDSVPLYLRTQEYSLYIFKDDINKSHGRLHTQNGSSQENQSKIAIKELKSGDLEHMTLTFANEQNGAQVSLNLNQETSDTDTLKGSFISTEANSSGKMMLIRQE